MAKIIKDKQIVEANEIILRLEGDGGLATVPAAGFVLVPLKQYLLQKGELKARGDFGVWFAPDDEVESLGGDAAGLSLIAVEFPSFVNGVGFSTGRLLRERYGFTGELRAFGDVFKDTINYLWRCGFNSFAVKEGKDLEDALAGLDDFNEFYQTGINQPQPLFRRR